MTIRPDPEPISQTPNLRIETGLWAAGLNLIAGVDEAGRGALAGPVTAAVLILPAEPNRLGSLGGLRDSKALSPHQRAGWADQLQDLAITWKVGFASPTEIDDLGIIPATRLAIRRALTALPVHPEHLLLDYLLLPEDPTPQTSMAKGDSRSVSIAGASIFAKLHRDRVMCNLDKNYPMYGFAQHKGYGTPGHRDALAKLGPSPVHRFSFAPIRPRTR